MEVPHLPATARCLAGIGEQTVAKFREVGAQGEEVTGLVDWGYFFRGVGDG